MEGPLNQYRSCALPKVLAALCVADVVGALMSQKIYYMLTDGRAEIDMHRSQVDR